MRGSTLAYHFPTYIGQAFNGARRRSISSPHSSQAHLGSTIASGAFSRGTASLGHRRDLTSPDHSQSSYTHQYITMGAGRCQVGGAR
jgi:hypothetical protein